MECCLRNVVRPWTSSAFFSFSRVSICRNLESSRLSRVIKVEPNIKALKNISEATSFRGGQPTHRRYQVKTFWERGVKARGIRRPGRHLNSPLLRPSAGHQLGNWRSRGPFCVCCWWGALETYLILYPQDVCPRSPLLYTRRVESRATKILLYTSRLSKCRDGGKDSSWGLVAVWSIWKNVWSPKKPRGKKKNFSPLFSSKTLPLKWLLSCCRERREKETVPRFFFFSQSTYFLFTFSL